MQKLVQCIFVLGVIIINYCHGTPTGEQMEKFAKIAKECKAKTGASDDDIQTLMKHELPDSKEAYCFMGCVQKELGVLTADNKIDMGKITEFAAPLKDKRPEKYEKLMTIANKCASEVSPDSDECDVSKKLMECCKRESDAAGLQITFVDIMS